MSRTNGDDQWRWVTGKAIGTSDDLEEAKEELLIHALTEELGSPQAVASYLLNAP